MSEYTNRQIILKVTGLLGDVIMTTPAIRAHKLTHPHCHITVLHEGEPSHLLLKGNPYIDDLRLVSDCHPDGAAQATHMDCSWAFNWGLQHGKTMIEGFVSLLEQTYNTKLNLDGLYYDYTIQPEEIEEAKKLIADIGDPSSIVLCARHSWSCSGNAERRGDPVEPPNKCFSQDRWHDLENWLTDKKLIPVAIGSNFDAQDTRFHKWNGPKLYGHPIRTVAALMSMCKLVISVDCGARHLAAAVGANLVTISCAVPRSLVRCAPIPGKSPTSVREYDIPINSVSTKVLKECVKYSL